MTTNIYIILFPQHLSVVEVVTTSTTERCRGNKCKYLTRNLFGACPKT